LHFIKSDGVECAGTTVSLSIPSILAGHDRFIATSVLAEPPTLGINSSNKNGTTLARHRSGFEARNWRTHTARIAWTAAWKRTACNGNPSSRPKNNDRIGAPCKASASTPYKRPSCCEPC